MVVLNSFLGRSIFLAQADSSDLGDFVGQIGGLLIMTCAAGVVWVLLMAVVMQRAAERRRRAKEGLPPLPGLHVAAYRAAKRWLNPAQASRPESAPVERAASRPAPESAPAMPAPDLAMLTGDLPQPDLGAMVGAEPEPVGDMEAEYPLPDAEPDLDPAPAPEAATSPAAGGAPGDAVEVLRVWRDVSDGALILEIDGQRVASPADVRATDLARRFANVARDLAALPASGEAGDFTPPDDSASPAPPPDAVELLRVWRDLADGGLIVGVGGRFFRSQTGLREAGLDRRYDNVVRELQALASADQGARPASTSAGTTSPAPGDPDEETMPSIGPASMFRQMTRVAMGHGPELTEHAPAKSIPEQIEDLLQARLANEPAFKGRRIHVRPSIEGGVRIEVDGTFYDGVGDVADEAVKTLLMDVVREWEDSQ